MTARIATVLVAAVLAATAAGGGQAQQNVRVEPREINDLLANPGMGWQTFHKFADEDPALEGLPSSTAYFRFYWKAVEPEEGQINWALFDGLLARARKAGQKLAFRIMTAGTGRAYDFSPPWLRELGLPGFEYRRHGGPLHWVPDLDDPRVLSRHIRLIKALGHRYDGHPDVALVDIGSVGLWGEWHMSGTGVDMPKSQTRRKIIDAYIESFRKTPLVMLIGDLDGLRYATSHGAGWRADCLGDMGGFSKRWSHMRDFYPQQIERAGIGEVWKRAPVAFETCWTVQKWVDEGWSVRQIFDWALAQHASYINNKSSRLPPGTRPLVENLLRVLGYRFVVRSVEHQAEVRRGRSLEVRMVWENVGVAPCYADYRPAVALCDATGKRRVVSLGEPTVRDWLPGKLTVVEQIEVPSKIEPGEYQLQVAVVDPSTNKPVIRLAIAGRRPDGWYPVSKVKVF